MIVVIRLRRTRTTQLQLHTEHAHRAGGAHRGHALKQPRASPHTKSFSTRRKSLRTYVLRSSGNDPRGIPPFTLSLSLPSAGSRQSRAPRLVLPHDTPRLRLRPPGRVLGRVLEHHRACSYSIGISIKHNHARHHAAFPTGHSLARPRAVVLTESSSQKHAVNHEGS